MVPNPVTDILIRDMEKRFDRRRQCDHNDREWNKPRNVNSPQKLEETRGDSPLRASRGSQALMISCYLDFRQLAPGLDFSYTFW